MQYSVPDDHPTRTYPAAGERFRVAGAGELLTVDTLEMAVTDDGAPTTFLVRTADGSRWVLRHRDPILDGIRFTGRALEPPSA